MRRKGRTKLGAILLVMLMMVSVLPIDMLVPTVQAAGESWDQLAVGNPYLNSAEKGIIIETANMDKFIDKPPYVTVNVTSEYLPNTTQAMDVAFIIDPFQCNMDRQNLIYQIDYILKANEASRVSIIGVEIDINNRTNLDFTRNESDILTALDSAINGTSGMGGFMSLALNQLYRNMEEYSSNNEKHIMVVADYEESFYSLSSYWKLFESMGMELHSQESDYNSYFNGLEYLDDNGKKIEIDLTQAKFREKLMEMIGPDTYDITEKFALNYGDYKILDHAYYDIEDFDELNKGGVKEFRFYYKLTPAAIDHVGVNEYDVFTNDNYIKVDGFEVPFVRVKNTKIAYQVEYQNQTAMDKAITGDLPANEEKLVFAGDPFVLPYAKLDYKGLNFQGWETRNSEFYKYGNTLEIKKDYANADYIITLVSAWSRPDALLVSEKADAGPPIMEEGAIIDIIERYKNSWNCENYKNVSDIVDVKFVQEMPTSAVSYVDVSKEKNGTVLMWLDYNSETDSITIYISSTGHDKVIATSCEYLFRDLVGVTSITGFEYFDTSAVTDMWGMFYGCEKLQNVDVSELDTSNVSDMGGVFSGCEGLESINLSAWNTSRVTSMGSMFSGCTKLKTINWGENYDTSNVHRMSSMFRECESLENLDLSFFDTSKVTDMNSMFYGAKIQGNLDFTGFDTSKVKTMDSMFYELQSLQNLDLSSFDTTSVTDMDNMFAYSELTAITFGENVDTSKVTTMKSMFRNCKNLTSLDLTAFTKLTETGKNTTEYMFAGCTDLADIKFGETFITKKDTNTTNMFAGCSSLEALDLSDWDTANVVNMGSMFDGCTKLKTINLKGEFGTGKVTYSMMYMFRNCSSLERVDLSNFDTEKVVSLESMFNGCSSLKEVDISGFDLSSAVGIDSIFSSCIELEKVVLGDFSAPVAKGRLNSPGLLMFSNCRNLKTVEVTNFNVPSLINMEGMFLNCTSLEELDVTGFKTPSVERMESMFEGCTSLKKLQGIEHLNTSVVAEMMNMFKGCSSLQTLDISTNDNDNDGVYSWDMNNVSDVSAMFEGCNMLNDIKIDHWSSASLTNGVGMFYDCQSLDEIDISSLYFEEIIIAGQERLSQTALFDKRFCPDNIVVYNQEVKENLCVVLKETNPDKYYYIQEVLPSVSITIGNGSNVPWTNSIVSNSLVPEGAFSEESYGNYNVVGDTASYDATPNELIPSESIVDYDNVTCEDTIDYGIVSNGSVIMYKVVVRTTVDESYNANDPSDSTKNTKSGVIEVRNTLPKEVEFNTKTEDDKQFVFSYNVFERGTFDDETPVVSKGSTAMVIGGPAGIVYDDQTRTITAQVTSLAADEELVFFYYTTVTEDPQEDSYYIPIQNQYTLQENGIKIFSNFTLHYMQKSPSDTTYDVTYEYDSTAPNGITVPTESEHKAGDRFILNTPKDVEGYTFNGWKYNDKAYGAGTTFTMPSQNVTFIGSFTKIEPVVEHKITYQYQLENDPVVVVKEYSYPENTYRLITDDIITKMDYYTFKEDTVSDENGNAVDVMVNEVEVEDGTTIEEQQVLLDKDIIVTRHFEKMKYQVTWLDGDNETILETRMVPWGTEWVGAEKSPTKQDHEWCPNFWEDTTTTDVPVWVYMSGTFTMPKRNVTLKPLFTPVISKNTITYQVRDGDEVIWFQIEEHSKNEDVTLIGIPTIEDTITTQSWKAEYDNITITTDSNGEQNLTMKGQDVVVYVNVIKVPSMGVATNYILWIGITGLALVLLINRQRRKFRRGGDYNRK